MSTLRLDQPSQGVGISINQLLEKPSLLASTAGATVVSFPASGLNPEQRSETMQGSVASTLSVHHHGPNQSQDRK